jgi:hypothetical protein
MLYPDLRDLIKAFIEGRENKFSVFKLINRCRCKFPPGTLFTICRSNTVLVSICPGTTYEDSKTHLSTICQCLGVQSPSDDDILRNLHCQACERGYQLYDKCMGEWFGTPTTEKIKFVFQPPLKICGSKSIS